MPTACLLGCSDPGHSRHISLDANGEDPAADDEGQVSAGGPAGSVVIHNGGMSDPNIESGQIARSRQIAVYPGLGYPIVT
jgi:hypothetical protein